MMELLLCRGRPLVLSWSLCVDLISIFTLSLSKIKINGRKVRDDR